MMKKIGLTLLAGLATVLVCSAWVAAGAWADYGFTETDVQFLNNDGSTASQAGSHPFSMTTSLSFVTQPSSSFGIEVPDGDTKKLTISQIPGLVGDTTAVPKCPAVEFFNPQVLTGPKCLPDTQVGVSDSVVGVPPTNDHQPVYNLTPPPGVAVRLAFKAIDLVPVVIDLTVEPNAPYRVVAHVNAIPDVVPFYSSKLTLWGTPGDPAHDKERACETGAACAGSQRPFITLPTACTGPLPTIFEGMSWQGGFASATATTHDEFGEPLGMTGCSRLGFNPVIGSSPTSVAASSPTGLDFSLDVRDEGLTSATGLAQSDIKRVTVTLPEAVSVNPALAEGLTACSETDLAKEVLGAAPGVGCPEASKIGTVEVQTPLLEETLKGSLYLASPYANPFGSLLGLYVVVEDPVAGILLKLPGEVIPNEQTGQLVSVFDNLPQLPFDHFKLSFRQGQRSPLVTPSACGRYTTDADLVPWSNPGSVLHDTATFQITNGVDGGPCPAGGVARFAPGLVAGSANNAAGAYTPVDVELTRRDGEQEITGFSTQLPAGLTANLTGVPFCSEAQIVSAKDKTGGQEEAEPSCPSSSQIGHTLVGVGVGSVLAYTPGRLFMAGPYQGAPFSIVAITSAKTGPFDLGTVVVHLPLNIDPLTAAVSIPAGAADQIPHIIKGIVVHVRDIRVYVDRPDFTLNPTNCNPRTLDASVIGSGQNFVSSTDDQAVNVSNRYQAANCANLGFKPVFKASTNGKTSRRAGASLNVSLTYPKAALGTQTNIASVKVELPKQLPSRLTTLQKACTAGQFNTNPAGCPAASIVGHATAITPILPVALTGPAYFVSHGGAKFPELVVVLQGYGVTIDLHGETFINGKTNITSSTFHTVPDQPVTSFKLTLPQGPNSALAAVGNLCTTKLKMPTLFTAQNGLRVKQPTLISVTGCAKHKSKPKHGHKQAHKGARKTSAAAIAADTTGGGYRQAGKG